MSTSVHYPSPICWDINLCTGALSVGADTTTVKNYTRNKRPAPTEIRVKCNQALDANDQNVTDLVAALEQINPTNVTLFGYIPLAIIDALKEKTSITSYIGKNLVVTELSFPSSVQVLKLCGQDCTTCTVGINADSLSGATNLTSLTLKCVTIPELNMQTNANLTSITLTNVCTLLSIPAWFGATELPTKYTIDCPDAKSVNADFWTKQMPTDLILTVSPGFEMPELKKETSLFNGLTLNGFSKFPPSFSLLRPKLITISTHVYITLWNVGDNQQLESLIVNAGNSSGGMLLQMPKNLDNLLKLKNINIRSAATQQTSFSFIGETSSIIDAAKNASRKMSVNYRGELPATSYQLLRNALVIANYPNLTGIDPDILTTLVTARLATPIKPVQKSIPNRWIPPGIWPHPIRWDKNWNESQGISHTDVD